MADVKDPKQDMVFNVNSEGQSGGITAGMYVNMHPSVPKVSDEGFAKMLSEMPSYIKKVYVMAINSARSHELALQVYELLNQKTDFQLQGVDILMSVPPHKNVKVGPAEWDPYGCLIHVGEV